MSDSYTTLWSQDRMRDLKRHGQEGARLTILFGGPHTSLPAFRRYGVHEGDWIYPIYVRQGVLHVIGRMRERGIEHVEDGRIKSVVSLQGIYRLAPESAQALEALLVRRLAESR